MSMKTICAIATAQGGAVGIVRVSGSEAIDIVNRIFSKDISSAGSYTMHYGRITDIDDVIVSVCRAPRSYTGEDTVEISCHGSSYILKQILQLLVDNGCELAGPGEFTQRAFLNGKMDLSQAEAVADLIELHRMPHSIGWRCNRCVAVSHRSCVSFATGCCT